LNAKTGFSPVAAVLVVVVLFLFGREESPKIGAMLDVSAEVLWSDGADRISRNRQEAWRCGEFH